METITYPTIIKEKDLITITDATGKKTELWGLVKARFTRHTQWKFDFDYIDALFARAQNPATVDEAVKALLFLNAEAKAEYEGRFGALEELGVDVTPEMKKSIHDSRNASSRDITSNSFDNELISYPQGDLGEAPTIGEMVEGARALIARRRRASALKRKVARSNKTKRKP